MLGLGVGLGLANPFPNPNPNPYPDPDQGTLAFAGHCQEDEGSGTPYVPRRPLVGHVNIDPSSIDLEIAPSGKGGPLANPNPDPNPNPDCNT